MRSFLERRAQLQPGARRALAAAARQRLRPQVAGARPGLDDETFLEHFAAAKARGKLSESAEYGPVAVPRRGDIRCLSSRRTNPPRRRPPGPPVGGASRSTLRLLAALRRVADRRPDSCGPGRDPLRSCSPIASACSTRSSIVLYFVYYTYFEGGPSGQTPGKKALGIRVYDFRAGGPIGYGRGFLRQIMKYVTLDPALPRLLLDAVGQGEADLARQVAGSVVVPADAYK